jgi:signal transduction histidine kinase
LPLPPGRQPPRVECAPDLPAINGDRAKLVQVVRNLVSNAYKYSPQGGDVVIRSLTATVEDRALAGFTVEDAGIGMTPAQCERAFDRFWRADLSGNIPGTGLGLSIVKEIVDLHEGSIEVSSEPGRGSVFTVLMPQV